MEYFRDIVIAAALCGIISYLSPGKDGVGKYVKYISSLVLLLVILSPVTKLKASAEEISGAIREFFSVSDEAQVEQDSYTAAIGINTAALAEQISAELESAFTLAKDDLSVSVTVDTTSAAELRIISVDIKLYTDNVSPEEAEAHVRSMGFDACNVTKGE